jgi:precorrin-3B synthase
MNAAAAGPAAISLISTQSTRRGACPTLDQPMPTGDGLLARVRVAGARLSPEQLSRIAQLTAEHGNGVLEVTARGNLQVRGLTKESAAALAGAVRDLVAIDTGVVIDHSPIAGLDPEELADPLPLVSAIRSGTDELASRLGPKVSVVVDGRGQVSLAALKADIRLVAVDATRWAVTLGGAKAQVMEPTSAVAATIAALGALAAIGPDARATDLFPPHADAPAEADPIAPAGPSIALRLDTGHTTAIALPFGSARASEIVRLAAEATAADVTVVRLAPAHRLLFDNAPPEFARMAADLGFITASDDPRRRISACIGSQGCASGHIPSRKIAAGLASILGPASQLHVSGCSKGCAYPRPAAVTLVGTSGGIGLVIMGRAGDTPQTFLDEAHLPEALVQVQSGK